MEKKKTKAILFIAVLFLLIFIATWIFLHSNIIAVYEYPTNITITSSKNNIGVGIRAHEMYFGEIPQGAQSQSGVIAYNFMNTSVKVKAYLNTNFNQWLEFTTPTEFILLPHEKKEINATVRAPADAKPGIYSGTLLVVFKKV